MLELKDVTLFVGAGEDVRPILADVSVSYPPAHFGAIIGPSGCGKSTLLKVVTGIAPGEEEGEIIWKGRDTAERDFLPSEIGYVPQFGIAHEDLTAGECVGYAMRLRVRGMHRQALRESVADLLEEVGLADARDTLVSVLSGGQKRRLALAMEIVSKPDLLLCDEVTSGLDPQSEDEIVRLLHGLSRTGGRIVLSVTHSLRHVELYDSVLVLCQGVVAYHGPPQFLTHYFRAQDAQELYAQLGLRTAKEWAHSWKKHRHAFSETRAGGTLLEPVTYDSKVGEEEVPTSGAAKTSERESAECIPGPGPLGQLFTLLSRRITIFFRNRAQLALQLGLVFGFPLLVAVFAWNGLPTVKNLSMGPGLDTVQQLVEAKEFLVQSSKVGSLVSGIVMFQVVLLALMGANNSGREIASERLIFEKEKLAGLNLLSYVASKAFYLGALVITQSLWMGVFVHYVCGFPGDLMPQLIFLALVNGAMTSVCLAVSSFMGSAEQSSLVSIYLVGFQLPLSGAVLALPDFLGQLVRPFVASYWSWSGILQTLKGERYYDIVQSIVQTSLQPVGLCLWVLGSHVVIGLFAAWVGCQRRSLK